MSMLKPLAVAAVLAASALATHEAPQAVDNFEAPAYTADGSLVAPAHYREWIFLSSGLDMSYASSKTPDHHMFDNTFVNPSSYREFLRTGTWPDKTTIVLEIRGAESPVSINKRGHTQGTEIMGHEIHVKDGGKWRFYDLPEGAAAAKVFEPTADCYSCHEAHGAVDTTFVQFYPTLLPIAQQKHTLSASYLKELAAPSSPEKK